MPVFMLFAMMSYMTYTQGKDPMMPFKNAASNIGGSFFSAANSVKDGVSGAGALLGSDQAKKPMSAERVYRWVDRDGVTHFGTFKPDEQVAFETIRVNPNHNIMDPFKLPVPETTEVTAQAPTQMSREFPKNPMPMSANPLEIKEMLNNIEDLNASRLQQLQSIQ